METKLHEINVTLSRDQKEEIFHAFIRRKKILLRLEDDALYGNDTLLVPQKSLKWVDHFLSDKEPFPGSFEWQKDHFMLDEKLFSEMLENGFRLVPSMNDEGVKSFRLYSPPTIDKILEEARENNCKGMHILLDYSSLTKLTEYSILKNIGKLMENIPSLIIYEKDGKYSIFNIIEKL